MNRKKLLIILIACGAFLLVGGRFFMIRQLSTPAEHLTTDITGPAQHSGTTLPTPDVTPSPIETEIDQDTTPQGENSTSPSIDTPPTEHNYTTPIQILVPPHIDYTSLLTLRKKIYQSHKVTAEFEQTQTRQAYQELAEENLTTPIYDIVLIPSIWRDDYKTWGAHISSSQPLNALFHPLVHTLLEDPTSTFIPFGIDLLVSISSKQLPRYSTPTIASLQQQITSISARDYASPTTFGISPSDLYLLAQGKSVYTLYAHLLNIIVEDMVYQGNTYTLDYFLQHTGRDPKTFIQTTQKLNAGESTCHLLPHICLLMYDEAAIGFASMSEIGLGSLLFSGESLLQTHTISPLPVNMSHYPTITRGFLINKDTPLLEPSILWLRGYLDHAYNPQLTLRNYILSPFNAVFKQQKIQDPYPGLLNAIQSLYVLTGSLHQTQKNSENTILLDMLQGNWSKTIYIQQHRE